MSKYHNRVLNTQDGRFDSVREFRRWQELKLMQKAGEIYELQRQVPFVLIPTQRDQLTGKVIERECKYIADFTYRLCKNGRIVVEDAKGAKTEVYKLKKKIMLYRHGIRIREV